MLKRAPRLLAVLLFACSGSSSLSSTLTEVNATDALVGSNGKLRITRANASVSAVLKLKTSDPAIATITDEVVMQDGELTVEVPWTGVSPGAVLFTATIGNSTINQFADVVTSYTVDEFFIDERALQVGATTLLELSMSASTATSLTLPCSSSDPAVASVPAELTVNAWDGWGDVIITALAPGATRITCTYDGIEYGEIVNVVATVSLFLEAESARVEVGGSVGFALSFDAAPAADEVIAFTSSAPLVASVPAQIVIRAGTTYVEGTVNVVGAGSTVITATFGTQQLSFSVTGLSAVPLKELFTTASSVTVGTPIALNLSLDGEPAKPTPVTFTSSNPAVLALPSSLSFASGDSSIRVSLTPIAAGTTTITATAGGASRSTTVVVVANVAIESFSAGDFHVGLPGQISILTNAESNTDALVTLTSSNPAVLSVPATVAIPAGKTFVELPVTPLAAGNSVITATLNGSTATSFAGVTQGFTLSSFNVGGSVLTGAPVDMSVAISAPQPTPTTVTLTSSNPSVLTVPASLSIDVGSYGVQTQIIAGQPGIAFLTATVGDEVTFATVEVKPSPVLSSIFADDTVQWGAIITISASLSPAPLADAPLTATISDPTILEALDNPVTIRAGQQSATLYFRAKNKTGTTDVLFKFGTSTAATSLSTKETPVISVAAMAPSVGGYRNVSVVSDCTLAAPITLNLASSNTAAFTIEPATVTLGASTSSARATVHGVAAGTGAITVTGPTGVTLPAPFPLTIP